MSIENNQTSNTFFKDQPPRNRVISMTRNKYSINSQYFLKGEQIKFPQTRHAVEDDVILCLIGI